MDRSKALAALSALAHGDRLDLIRLLVAAGDGGMAAGDIARELGLSASRLSFHLSAVIYAVDAAGLGRVLAYLLNDCCLSHPEVVAGCRHGQPPAETRLPAAFVIPAREP
jgi:ArsR family transcriptional regulator, arsenate/arsenite/antimonite-responsive transcriptional repressor